MDLSGVIFVAVAVAWAVYLIPKALKQHEDAASSRTIDRFSHTMRVLARREPEGGREARLVVSGERASVTVSAADVPEVVVPTAAEVRARRAATQRATRRRRRVLGTLLLATGVVAGLAAYGLFSAAYVGIPGGLIVVWLVLCRVMVKGEIRADRAVLGRPGEQAPEAVTASHPTESEVPEDYQVVRNEQGFDEVAAESETSVALPVADPDAWDPVPVTLPTYVTKAPAARRTVRTIDLDATGVWTSGNTAADTALARQADAERSSEQGHGREAGGEQRAVGS